MKRTALLLVAVIAMACGDAVEPVLDLGGPPTVAATPTTPVNTYVVTTTADAGVGSLRQAILDANGSAGFDAVHFAISTAGDPGCSATTGVCTIRPVTPLPTIVDPVIVDGYTQTGASPNTAPMTAAIDAVLAVELDGSLAGPSAQGLSVTAGASVIRGLVINRFAVSGITLKTAGGNRIEGNFIGTDPTGTIALGNTGAGGIFIGNSSAPSHSNYVGGPTPDARNLIAGNAIGLNIQPTDDNVVQGNFLGTDVTGTQALGNGRASVFIFNGATNQIGGPTVPERNLISGNTGTAAFDGFGVEIGAAMAVGNVVEGNLIGTDVSGTAALPNETGISAGGAGSRIGGSATGAGNVISGNSELGIFAIGTGTAVIGNLIGLDHTGAVGLGNSGAGVRTQAANAVIGGTDAGAGNVISANATAGVFICGGQATTLVQGNLIGTDISGTADLGNQTGIDICVGTSNSTIGGPTAAARNVISGNFNGIFAIGSNNTIQGNFIGTDVTGTAPLPNERAVHLQQGASDNLIGGTTPGAGNVIAFNDGRGVFVLSAASTGNAIRRNTFHSNTQSVWGNGLAITLALGNNEQDFPTLTAAVIATGGIVIDGTLQSAAGTTFDLEFFSNQVCDPSGFGEGEVFLGTANVTTDASGSVDFTASLAATVADGSEITATATDPNGNTSEFSQCLTAELSAEAALQFLLDEVLNNPNLNGGQANALSQKLDNIVSKLDGQRECRNQSAAGVHQSGRSIGSGRYAARRGR